MTIITQKTRFDNAGYYFIGLVAIVLLGFWKSYFSLLTIAVTNDYAFYFHFHAAMVSLWVVILIVQPILIRKKQLNAHRLIGKLCYLVMPLLLVSIFLMHNYIGKLFPGRADFMFVLGAGILPLSILFAIAIWKRHNVNVHARAMVSTGILFIEPAFIRFLFRLNTPPPVAHSITMAIISVLLITLIIVERKQQSGRWIFPLTLFMYLAANNLHIKTLNPFAEWLVQLPLTPSPMVKDLPVPGNEIDGYAGNWDDERSTITYRKENQLWMRWTERGKADSTRLLFQGNGEFIGDKNRPLMLYFKLKDGRAEAFNSYFAYVYNGTVKRK
jgi:hypothetical protein